MYKEYFGLKENPFSIAPDPHYFYMSEGHREALAHLVYGINSAGGFILLTGEVGTGKTTVCRCLLEQMPEDADIAFILNPRLTVEELLASVCDEFGIVYPEGTTSIKVFVSAIYDYLLSSHAKGRRAILIIEEAQNLSVEVLEQVRLLTNLETNQRKLLQIIMLGQPELRSLLSRSELRQLSQRVTARYHLGPLKKHEVPAYVQHRLSVAGLVRGQPFPEPTLRELYRLTGGVPRLINVICDRALTGAYVQGKEQVDRKTLLTAAREVSGEEVHRWWKGRVFQGVSAGCLLLLCIAVAVAYYAHEKAKPPASAVKTGATEARKVTAGTPKVAAATLAKPPGTTRASARDAAYRALFEAWQIRYDPKDKRAPGDQAAAQGLRYVAEKSSLSSLRQINKPAVLTLLDEKDGEYYATLTSLKGDRATFMLGDEERSVYVNEIAVRWSGAYQFLWRPPAGYRGRIEPGSRSPLVALFRRQLALAQRRNASSNRGTVYDNEMVKQVKEFQVSVGLEPDGVLGWRTMISLADAAGESGPLLKAAAKGAN
jgi:general secretion pathway protein A